MSHTTSTTAHNQQTIDDCHACEQTCLTTIEHAMTMGGEHAEPEHMAMLRECAELCKVTANEISRKADNIEAKLKACAESCEASEKKCRHIHHDHAMVACADACKKAAASCRHLAAA